MTQGPDAWTAGMRVRCADPRHPHHGRGGAVEQVSELGLYVRWDGEPEAWFTPWTFKVEPEEPEA